MALTRVNGIAGRMTFCLLAGFCLAASAGVYHWTGAEPQSSSDNLRKLALQTAICQLP